MSTRLDQLRAELVAEGTPNYIALPMLAMESKYEEGRRRGMFDGYYQALSDVMQIHPETALTLRELVQTWNPMRADQ